jgi:hypothetical protein
LYKCVYANAMIPDLVILSKPISPHHVKHEVNLML